jgi:peptidoglycan lytic transglycosylase G
MTDAGVRRLAVAALALCAIAFTWALFQPFEGSGGDRVRVTIPRQAGVSRIGELLDREGVVPSGALFSLRARLAGETGDLKPGVYHLREHMTYTDVLDRLVGGPGTDFVQLTIPEGLSRSEIAPLARRAGLRGDYAQASAETSLLDFRRYGLRKRPRTLEGFLFPATYELRRGAYANALVAKQLAAFGANFGRVDLSYARSKNLTAFDVLTIASMVEREAQLARERPLIAAVIYNRLHARQVLAIDATIRYATGNWSSPLTKSQLALDTPYNTRLNPGLPPGPIGNPGLASIEAAARPARVGYLYYVVKPGTCGEHAFSSTLAKFQADERRYQQARDAAGGMSPTSCP